MVLQKTKQTMSDAHSIRLAIYFLNLCLGAYTFVKPIIIFVLVHCYLKSINCYF